MEHVDETKIYILHGQNVIIFFLCHDDIEILSSLFGLFYWRLILI